MIAQPHVGVTMQNEINWNWNAKLVIWTIFSVATVHYLNRMSIVDKSVPKISAVEEGAVRWMHINKIKQTNAVENIVQRFKNSSNVVIIIDVLIQFMDYSLQNTREQTSYSTYRTRKQK